MIGCPFGRETGMIVSPIVNYPAGGLMFIDADCGHGRAGRGPRVHAARTGPAHLRPVERSSLALVVDAAEDHWQRMHAAALGFPAPPTGDPDASSP